MRQRSTHAVGIWAASAVTLLTASCTSSQVREVPLPDIPSVTRVVMRDYRFDPVRPPRRGRAIFQVHNKGTMGHDLTLVKLSPDLPPLDVVLKGDAGVPALPLAMVPQRAPRSSGKFAVDLVPGRYGLVCTVKDPDGVSHARKGMNLEITIP